jgi:hypothetical protein
VAKKITIKKKKQEEVKEEKKVDLKKKDESKETEEKTEEVVEKSEEQVQPEPKEEIKMPKKTSKKEKKSDASNKVANILAEVVGKFVDDADKEEIQSVAKEVYDEYTTELDLEENVQRVEIVKEGRVKRDELIHLFYQRCSDNGINLPSLKLAKQLIEIFEGIILDITSPENKSNVTVFNSYLKYEEVGRIVNNPPKTDYKTLRDYSAKRKMNQYVEEPTVYHGKEIDDKYFAVKVPEEEFKNGARESFAVLIKPEENPGLKDKVKIKVNDDNEFEEYLEETEEE